MFKISSRLTQHGIPDYLNFRVHEYRVSRSVGTHMCKNLGTAPGNGIVTYNRVPLFCVKIRIPDLNISESPVIIRAHALSRNTKFGYSINSGWITGQLFKEFYIWYRILTALLVVPITYIKGNGSAQESMFTMVYNMGGYLEHVGVVLCRFMACRSY